MQAFNLQNLGTVSIGNFHSLGTVHGIVPLTGRVIEPQPLHVLPANHVMSLAELCYWHDCTEPENKGCQYHTHSNYQRDGTAYRCN